MKTCSALSPTVIFLVFFNGFAFGQTTRDSTCLLTATYNETLLAELAKHFDKDSSTVIIEYTLSFNSYFDYSTRSAPDAFQPWKWYRTQGKYSSQLLLSYELYYGLLKHILIGNIKAVTIHVDVSPAGCFHQLENKEIEALVLNFLLKDFRIDGNAVAHSFTYSEDVEICTARLGEGVSWGALIYKCCGYDSSNHVYCDDVAANDWMLALIIFIIVMTSFVALYLPLMVPKPHIEDDFYYMPKDGNVLEFQIKVENSCDCSKDDSPSLSVNHLKRMKEFYDSVKTKLKLDENIPKRGGVFKIRVKEVHTVISTSKLILENKRTINVFGNILDFFIDHEQHQGDIECTLYFRRILRFGFMVALALPSFPLAYAVSAKGMWHRQVADANKSFGRETYLYKLWRISPETGLGITVFVYVVYFFHIFLLVFCENFTQRFYKYISPSSDSKHNLNPLIKFFMKKMMFNDKAHFRCVQNLKYIIDWFVKSVLFVCLFAFSTFSLLGTPFVLLWGHDIPCSKTTCKPCKILFACDFFFFFLVSYPAAVFIFLIGINFFLHVAVMIITILVVQSSLLYEVIPIIILLIFYIWDSFNQVQNPFNEFMKTLVAIDFFKDFHTDSNVMFKRENRVQSFVEDTSKGKKKYLKLQVRNGAVLLNIKEPFIYSNEFKISKKFFLHCATVDYSGAPQSLGHNYKKAFVRFLKIAIFVVFVFLVMMAFGHISFISPSSRTFLTFFAGILPHILNKFSKSYNPFTKDIGRDERFQRKLNDRIESFEEKWKVKDIYIDDDIKEVNDTKNIDLKVVISSNKEKCACFPANSNEDIESVSNSSPLDIKEHGVWYRKRKTVRSQIVENNNSQSKDPSALTNENTCETETVEEQGKSGGSQNVENNNGQNEGSSDLTNENTCETETVEEQGKSGGSQIVENNNGQNEGSSALTNENPCETETVEGQGNSGGSQIVENNNGQNEGSSALTNENPCETETVEGQGKSESPKTAVAPRELEIRVNNDNGSKPVNNAIA